MSLLAALLLGLVEGVTEYLPVSSTGHLILAAWLLGLGSSAESWSATFTFNIVIQAGAILAVLALYRGRVGEMVAGAVGRSPAGRRLLLSIVAAFLPAAVVGLALSKTIEARLNGPWPVVGALFIGGLVLLAVGRFLPKRADARGIESMTLPHALLIGLAQCLALWPGTSRSMTTIVAALLLGYAPAAAAEFSFLLALPTLGAATAYKAWKDGSGMVHQLGLPAIVVGFVVAAVSAALAVRWLVGYLQRRGVAAFGWYRIAIAAAFAALLVTNVMAVPKR